MRKMVMCRKRIKTSGGRRFTLIYSVTIDELSHKPRSPGIESYGASVCIKESGEEACIRNITLRSAEIFELTGLLAANYVTPATCLDVINDWLCR